MHNERSLQDIFAEASHEELTVKANALALAFGAQLSLLEELTTYTIVFPNVPISQLMRAAAPLFKDRIAYAQRVISEAGLDVRTNNLEPGYMSQRERALFLLKSSGFQPPSAV